MFYRSRSTTAEQQCISEFSELCCSISDIACRGGVEDTRLEAKAKDTKKIRGQGQGQPFQGQTLSRPRTGMLEAKDQGHKRKCSPKKKKKVFTKVFQAISTKKRFPKKIFQAISTKKRFPKNFSSDLHKNTFSKKIFSSDLHKKTFSKTFFKRSTKF